MKKYPQKKNETSFTVAPGVEPKNSAVTFRTAERIKLQIVEAAKKEGVSLTEWMEKAVEEYLKK
jgi:predicted HicB family RNase H-like nuclease